MKYRKEIDGLRGISVLAIILFHSKIEILGINFSGGYVGVDIFFVISGFLISSIYMRKIHENTFNLKDFYFSRAKRILPALYFMLIASLIVALIIFPPIKLVDFSKSLISVLLFYSNFHFLNFSTNYFSFQSDFLPLIHTWSLGVEEQFYILFPISLIFVLNHSKKIFNSSILILFFTSLIYCQLGGNLNFQSPYIEEEIELFNQPFYGSFYSTFGRLWEIALGVLLAIYKDKINKIFLKNIPFIEYLGLLMIILSIIFFDKDIAVPNFFLLIPTIGVSILLVKNNYDNSLVYKILTTNFLIFTGLISYSLYLFHQPILAYSKVFLIQSTLISNFIILSIIFLSGYISWRFVETPFRNKNKFSKSKIINFFLIIFVILIISSLVLINKKGLPERYNVQELVGNEINLNYVDIDKQKIDLITTNSNQAFPLNNQSNYLIIGDSMAEDLFLSMYLNSDKFSNINFSLYSPKIRIAEFKDKKNKIKNKIKNFLQSNLYKDADYIIISGAYYFDTNKGKIDDEDGFPIMSDIFKRDNKKVFITSSQPSFYTAGSDILSYVLFRDRFINKINITDLQSLNKYSINLFNKDLLNIDRKIKKLSEVHGYKYLDKYNLQCEKEKMQCIVLLKDNSLAIIDSGHYSLKGAKYFGIKIYNEGWFKDLND